MFLLSGNFYQLTTNIILFLLLNVQLSVESSNWYGVVENTRSSNHDVRLWGAHHRVRRAAASEPSTTPTSTTALPTTSLEPATTPPTPSPNATSNKTVVAPPVNTNQVAHESTTQVSATTPTVHTPIRNVGVNGSGIQKDIKQPPKVSEPIVSDDGGNNASKHPMPETIKPEHNLDNLTYVNHTFYNTTFIGLPSFFQDHWDKINKMQFETHPILSSSHRRATTVSLSFNFPYYGQPLKNVTVATGGFIYTGEHVHNWLAATQYIAPLMANFDTRPRDDSLVKIADDGTNFTVVWENVCLQGHEDQTYTFAATLRSNGDIIFAYKDIPVPVQFIEDKDHPVKVGISDAYLQERVVFYKRRKTIYEYHRVNCLDHNITSGTILRLHALPTCLLYSTCQECTNHNTSFNCSWCEAAGRCSHGTDRQQQDWVFKNCDKAQITKEAECPAGSANATATKTGESTSFVNEDNPYHNVIMKHDYAPPVENTAVLGNASKGSALVSVPAAKHHSSLGGVVVAFVTIVLISFVAAWVFYAYKNPHTRSGQFLIKYRPSTWSWKRGEARYTAATIHM